MHPMLQKNVDSNFITEEQGNYIEEAIKNKESLIISGHRSAGVRVFMATCMAIAKASYTSVQVKSEADLEKEVEYYLIPGIDADNFEEIIQTAFSKEDSSVITLKEPEHPYSIIKIMKKSFKETKNTSKVVTLLECRKIDNVPYLINLNKMSYDENGKIVKEEAPREF